MKAEIKEIDFEQLFSMITTKLSPEEEEIIHRNAQKFEERNRELVKNALISKGLNPDVEWIKQNVSCVEGGDGFMHYFFKHGEKDAVRIISIDENPPVEEIESGNFSEAKWW